MHTKNSTTNLNPTMAAALAAFAPPAVHAEANEDRVKKVIADAIGLWPAGRVGPQANEVFHAIRCAFQEYPELRGVFLTCSECRKSLSGCSEEWVRSGVCSSACWGYLHMEAA